MQASQSNNASDLLKLNLNVGLNADSDPAADVPRGFPSPFSSPIQAARRYMERQKSDAWQNAARDQAAAGYKSSPASDALAARGAETRNRIVPESVLEGDSCEREWRLERSLYQGHSVEAGLNFEAIHVSGIQRMAAVERASIAASDGSESVFPYATPGPAPDPAAVRGAILRLARESELSREPRSVRGGSSDQEPAKSAKVESSASATFPSANFGDVARRVWEASVAQPDSDAAKSPAAEMETATQAPTSELGGTRQVSPEESSNIYHVEGTTEQRAGEQHGTSASQVEPAGLQLQAATPPIPRNLPPGTGTAPANGPVKIAPAAICEVERAPALAHDACNLLSGLALYGELLGSAGVLDEPYRHYAEELKLIAARSKLLIDRLLQVVETRKDEAAASLDGLETTSAPRDAISDGETEGTQATSIADLLLRWGSLLSTLAHGTLEVEIGPHAATPIPVPAEALERILVNLVRNARTATLEGGTIRIGVRAEDAATLGVESDPAKKVESGTSDTPSGVQHPELRSGGMMVLTVDDCGCGMTESQISRILGSDTSTDEQLSSQISTEAISSYRDGTRLRTVPLSSVDIDASAFHRGMRQGLGLQIVRQLTAASGGALSIQSWPGRGTRIEIRWPLRAASIVRDLPKDDLPKDVAEEAKPDDVEASSEGILAPPQLDPPLAIRTAPRIVEMDQPRAAVGPDGFSEPELRAMMLRLHRAGPQERSPLSRRLSSRIPETREVGHQSSAPDIAAYAFERNNPASEENAAEGAIAC